LKISVIYHVLDKENASAISEKYVRRGLLQDDEILYIQKDEYKNEVEYIGIINAIISKSTGDILVFLDSGCFPSSDYMDNIRKSFEDSTIAIAVSGYIIFMSSLSRMKQIIGVSFEDIISLAYEDFGIFAKYVPDFNIRNFGEDNYSGLYNSIFNISRQCAIRKASFVSLGGLDDTYKTAKASFNDFFIRSKTHWKCIALNETYIFYDKRRKMFMGDLTPVFSDQYRLLNQKHSLEMEISLSFPSVNVPEALENMKKLCKYICDNKDAQLNSFTLFNNEIYISLPDNSHPNGWCRYVEDGKEKGIELFGFMLPFSNRHFKRAVISYSYCFLPEGILAALLQECLRIAETVALVTAQTEARIHSNIGKFEIPWEFNENHAIVSTVNYFDFSRNGDFILVVWKEGCSVKYNKNISSDFIKS
jgi:hypothetical protein